MSKIQSLSKDVFYFLSVRGEERNEILLFARHGISGMLDVLSESKHFVKVEVDEAMSIVGIHKYHFPLVDRAQWKDLNSWKLVHMFFTGNFIISDMEMIESLVTKNWPEFAASVRAAETARIFAAPCWSDLIRDQLAIVQ